MLIQIRDVPAAATTHSEIQDTTLPSTFSNFMVKMLWLQEKAVWIFSRSRQTGSRSSWMLLTSCWRTGSSLWLRRSCSCSRAAGFCRPRPNSGHWPTWDLEKRNGIRQTVSQSRTALSRGHCQGQTFDVSVPGAVIANPERRPFLGLGAERRLQQVVHQLVVDFEERHPQCELAAARFCWVTGGI